MIGNISRHVLWFVCFPAQTLPSSGFWVAHFKVYSYLDSSVNGSEDGSKCWYRNCFSEIVMWKKGSVGVLVMTGRTCWSGQGSKSKHWFTTSFLQPLSYSVTP